MVKQKHSQNYFSARSVITIILVIFTLAGLAVGVSVYSLLDSLDKHTGQNFAERVDIALEKEKQFISLIAEEYSYWDIAYQKIFFEHDAEWLEANSGQYLIDQYEFDFSAGIGPQLQPAYLVASEDFAAMDFGRLMASGLNTMIKAVQQLNEASGLRDGIVNSYIQYDGKIFLVTMQSFKDETSEKIRPGAYLAVGRCLDRQFRKEIASSYKLLELNLSYQKPDSRWKKVLLSINGDELGYLTWPYPNLRMIIGPKIIGIICLFFGSAIALVIFLVKREHSDRAAYEEQLFCEATLDPLTDVNNRRYFSALSQQEISIHNRDKRILSVIIFDIDHFKRINDTYGHGIGDRAIIHFTDLCTSELRGSDIMGRIGGEEFAVLLPQTPLEKAVEVAERIRARIETSPLEVDGKSIAMTVSIGVTVIREHDLLDDMLHEADKALYKAKEQGRNQVCVFAHEETSSP